MRRELSHLSHVRIARSVTMECRSFARTLLWRNNHTHRTLLAVYRNFIKPCTLWLTKDGTTATVSQMNLWCLHEMPDINNNYIAWPIFGRYQNILPALGPYCTCATDACNMVLARAIYSGIPLIAMQYNINIQWENTFPPMHMYILRNLSMFNKRI